MATRTILTMQPVLRCELCARSLLRGEHPQVFLHAGERQIVCELCAPRATQEGWLRASDSAAASPAPPRRRHGRGFFSRLLAFALGGEPELDSRPARGAGEHPAGYELLDGAPQRERITGAAAPEPSAASTEELAAEEPGAHPAILQAGADAFNASEFPRRVAGVARSLGAPEVSVAVAKHLDSAVRIVIAWELCWYRYEIDFSEEPAVMHVLAQGSELGQLEHDERLANGLVAPSGAITLTPPRG